jgi:hypothetical protein
VNKITLECLNNLLQPVNMRCREPFKGVYFIEAINCTIYAHESTDDATDIMNYELLTPEDLGFEITEEGE